MKKILILLLIILLCTCTSLLGEPKGKLTEKATDDKGKLGGKVVDYKGNLISSAKITLMDGETIVMSETTKKNGSYFIDNIKPGVYDISCMCDGFKTQKKTGVEIKPGLTAIENFNIYPQSVVKDSLDNKEGKVEIINPTKTQSGKTISTEEIEDISVTIIEDVVAFQAGATLNKGEINVRGGRSEETEYTVDGMSVSDPVDGGAVADPAKKDKPKVEIVVEDDLDSEDDEDMEVIETIGATSLEPYEEISAPEIKERVKTRPKKPRSGVTASSYSGLKAGFVDDNKQFNYFLNFLEKYERKVTSFPINITERIILNIKDGQGKSLPDAKLQFFSGEEKLESGLSYSDGRYLFFPTEYDKTISEYRLEVEYSGITEEVLIYRQGKREIDIQLANIQKASSENIPLDILFILDTTGSMGEEIRRLRNSIEIINLNISEISPTPDIRYGMVLYRDIEDVYNTKIIPLNDSLSAFQEQLFMVSSGGGGDSPENLQAALDDALNKIKWRENGVRLAFIITDAPAHLDYKQDYTYVDAVHDAKRKGIKLFSIGTGGLPLDGEYVLRQISQYTFANYVFLTYGEKGESEGGKPGSVSHHTGENFQTDKLEAIIIRKVKED